MSTSVDLCTPLPASYQYHDPKGEALTQELLDAIVDALNNSPRSLQKAIGASEVGIPCNRLLGYKLLGIPERPRVPAWKAAVGTGGHLLMEDIFDAYNLRNAQYLDGQERFYIETKVVVGEINGEEITGTSDVYDRVTDTVIDWKFPGPTPLNNARRKGPSPQYRDQIHLNGRGWVRAGFNVKRVMVFFLPRHGELADAHPWSEPYDEQIAIDALQRLEGIDVACRTLGVAALKLLPTEVHYCTRCPYFKHKSTILEEGCPGDPKAPVNQDQTHQFEGLIGITQKQETLV